MVTNTNQYDFDVMVRRMEGRGYIVNSYNPDVARRYKLSKKEGPGERDISPYLPKWEFLEFLNGFEAGIREAQDGIF